MMKNPFIWAKVRFTLPSASNYTPYNPLFQKCEIWEHIQRNFHICEQHVGARMMRQGVLEFHKLFCLQVKLPRYPGRVEENKGT